MEIVLLERMSSLGQMGDVVRVRNGYARNYLLPRGKALRATKDNLARFEGERAQMEAQNLTRRTEAQEVAERLGGEAFVIIRQSSETGQLYGSVRARDVTTALGAGGFTIRHAQALIAQPIKTLGLHEVEIRLHPEVSCKVVLNVARTPDEAERQARGEDVTATEDEAEDSAQAALAAEAVSEASPDPADAAPDPAAGDSSEAAPQAPAEAPPQAPAEASAAPEDASS